MKEKRTGKKDRKLLWGTIIISMILSLMVFYVLYNANNKYMTREEKAIHGILYADGSYDSLPVYYLSREWEYYPDVLLTLPQGMTWKSTISGIFPSGNTAEWS